MIHSHRDDNPIQFIEIIITTSVAYGRRSFNDLDVIRSADYIIDMGPEGGEDGGRIVACGTPEEIRECKDSITGSYI